MSQLEERLRTAGRSHTDITPDLGSIRKRGLRIRRNRQIGTSLAAVVLVAVGGVAALNAFRPESDSTMVSASDGGMSDDGTETDTTVPAPDGESTDDTAAAVDPDSTDEDSADNSADGSSGAVPAVSGEGDGSAGGAAAGGDVSALSAPSPGSVSDGTGGWLTATQEGIEHLRSDNTTGMIDFADPVGGFVQRWPTDVVAIDGRHYLLVDQFVPRRDLEAERTRALAESYGIAYDSESGIMGLEGVATPEELDSLNHWEVSILAVDLATDEVRVVETRIINRTHSADWVYNGHITSDGSNILVMRELWQGYCLYAEGLTLDGQPVAVDDAAAYPKPQGIDSMTYEEIDGVFSGRVDPPQPCRTLDDVPDSGLAVWGTQADPDQIEAFQIAFYEAGLG